MTKLQDQGDSVLVRQSQIDNENVEGALDGEPLGRFSVRRSFNLISRFFKRTAQETLNIDFVFNEQKPHEGILVHFARLFRVDFCLLGSTVKNSGDAKMNDDFICVLISGHIPRR